MKKHLKLQNARIPAQANKMKKLIKLGICPFCKENFAKHHDNPILRETKSWIVSKNDYPYDGTKTHILLVFKKHADSFEKISPKEITEFLQNIKWIKKKFKIPGGSLFMRFGDHDYTGATVTHLHAHIISGSKQNKGTEIITTVMGYKKSARGRS